MSKGAVADLAIRTLDQKGRGNPFDPANYGEIVKPGELVDIVELNPLTLADRRIYNLLIANNRLGADRRADHTSDLQNGPEGHASGQ